MDERFANNTFLQESKTTVRQLWLLFGGGQQPRFELRISGFNSLGDPMQIADGPAAGPNTQQRRDQTGNQQDGYRQG